MSEDVSSQDGVKEEGDGDTCTERKESSTLAGEAADGSGDTKDYQQGDDHGIDASGQGEASKNSLHVGEEDHNGARD